MKLRYLILLLFLLPSIQIIAQDRLDFPIAAYQLDGGLYVFGLEDAPILVLENETGYLPDASGAAPIWSPDGRQLAYQTEQGSSGYRRIFLSVIDDLSSQTLVAEPILGTNLAFSLDSEKLLFSRDGEWLDAENADGIEHGTWRETQVVLESFELGSSNHEGIMSSNLPRVHQIHLSAGLPYYASCPSSGMALSESRWTQFAPLILRDSPFGIVSYFNQYVENGRDSNLQIGDTLIHTPLMTNASLDPLLSQLVFTVENENQIGIVDLAQQSIQVYDISHKPEAIVGNRKGYLYYSVRIEGEELLPDAYWENSQFWYLECSEHINQVMIYQFEIETEIETPIFSFDGHSIPWMSLAPDGQSLYFTMIPNGEVWREKMLENQCKLYDCREYLFPSLYRFDMVTLEAELVLENVMKPVINYGYAGQ